MTHPLTSVLFIQGSDGRKIPFIRPPKTPLVSKSIQKMKEQCRRGFPTGKLKREHSTVEREYRPLDIIITTVTQPLKIMQKKRVNVTVQNKTAAKTGELYDFPEDIEECFHQGLLSKLSTNNGKPEHGVAPTSTRKLLSQKQQQQQDREETEDVYRQSRGKHFQCHSNMISKGQTKRSAKQTDHCKKKTRRDAFVPQTPCISIKDSNPEKSDDSRQIKYPFSVPETPLLHGVNSEQEYLNLQGVKTAVPVHYRELGPNQKIFTVPETPLVQQCTMQESPLLGGSDMNFPEDIYALQWPWNKQHAQVVPETPILQ